MLESVLDIGYNPFFAALLSAALLVSFTACDRGSPPPGQGEAAADAAGSGATGTRKAAAEKLDRSHAGNAAPDVTFEGPDGAPTSLDQYKGTPVLVNLWATWCGPCVEEMPTLDALAVREKGKLQVLTVSQDLEGAAKVDPYFKKAGFKMIQPYLDPENGLNFAYNTGIMPTSVLYDAKGREVWRIVGGLDWTSEKARKLLAEAPDL